MPGPVYSRGKAKRRWGERRVKFSLLHFCKICLCSYIPIAVLKIFLVPDMYSHSTSADIFLTDLSKNQQKYRIDGRLKSFEQSNIVFLQAKELVCASFVNLR